MVNITHNDYEYRSETKLLLPERAPVITFERINTTFLVIVDTIFKRGEEVFHRTEIIINRLKTKRAKGMANLFRLFPEEVEPNPLFTRGSRNRSGEI